jgi:hypothetical protein
MSEEAVTMAEVVFEVARILPPRCTYPDCTREALWKIRIIGGNQRWTLVCGTHRIRAKRMIQRGASEIRVD